MASLTASFAGSAQPALVVSPAYVERTQKYVLTTTLSAGDIIGFPNLKIPHGATITKFKFHGTHPNGATIFNAGLANGEGTSLGGALFGSGTLSGTVAYKNLDFDPYKFSASDSLAPAHRYCYPIMTAATVTSATGSLSLGVTVGYIMGKSNW